MGICFSIRQRHLRHISHSKLQAWNPQLLGGCRLLAFYVSSLMKCRMLVAVVRLTCEANNDGCTGGDVGARGRRLIAGDAAADGVDFEAVGFGFFYCVADGLANKGRNDNPTLLDIENDSGVRRQLCGGGLRGRWFIGRRRY